MIFSIGKTILYDSLLSAWSRLTIDDLRCRDRGSEILSVGEEEYY